MLERSRIIKNKVKYFCAFLFNRAYIDAAGVRFERTNGGHAPLPGLRPGAIGLSANPPRIFNFLASSSGLSLWIAGLFLLANMECRNIATSLQVFLLQCRNFAI